MFVKMFFLYIPGITFLLLVVCWVVSRCILWYLSWWLKRRHNLIFSVKLGLASLKNVKIQLPSLGSVEIQKVSISSCLLSSRCRTLFCIWLTNPSSEIMLPHLPVSTKDSSEHTGGESHVADIQQNNVIKYLCFISKVLSFQTSNGDLKLSFGTSNRKIIFHTVFQDISFQLQKQDDEPNRFEVFFSLTGASINALKFDSMVIGQTGLFSFGMSGHCLALMEMGNKQPIKRLDLGFLHPEIVLYQGFSPRVFDGILPPNQKSLERRIPPNNTNHLSKIPNSVTMKLETFDLKWVQVSLNKSLSLSLQTVETELKFQSVTKVCSISLSVQNGSVTSGQLPLASLLKIGLNFKVENRVVDTNIMLTSCHILYHHEEFAFWRTQLPHPTKENNAPVQKEEHKMEPFLPFIQDHRFQGHVEINDVFASFSLPKCSPFSAGLSHSHLVLDLFFSGPNNSASNLAGGVKEITLELLLETIWFSLGDGCNVNSNLLKRQHQWGIPICLGMLLLKARNFPSDLRIQCMADGVRGEWSPAFVVLLPQLFTYHENHFPKRSKPRISEEDHTGNSKLCFMESFTLQFSLTNANVFFLCEQEVGIMVRVDALNVDTATEKVFLTMDSFKSVQVCPEGQTVPCLKSSEINNHFAFVQTLRLNLNKEAKEFCIKLSDEVFLQWTTGAHMCAVTLSQDILSVKKLLKSSKLQSDAVYKPSEKQSSYQIRLLGNINISFILSSRHKLAFVTAECVLKTSGGRLNFQSDHLEVLFNQHTIFMFENPVISTELDSEQHLINRQSFDGLSLKNNKAWKISMEEAHVLFPYQYNFAEAFSEEALSIVKWLKVIHKKKKQPFTSESSLPPDLIIKIKLLEDEYHESLKRKSMLDKKIEDLRKTHLLLPAGKLEELYVTLAKKNADIYVQRSRQLYGSSPMRTSLWTWNMENIEIMALADTSYHGRDKVLEIMQELDHESPFPEEGMEFNTLWCRKVRASTQYWSFHLRDFSQALFEIREFHTWGTLLGAEQEAAKRDKRMSTIEIEQPWGNASVERSMPPLKFYHDLTFDLDSLCYAHGPCWDPVMAQVNLAFEWISKPSLDPSPTLPWWDKMRLLLHGHLTFSIHHLSYLLRASSDPYNTTEQVEIAFTDILIDWTNGKIMTKGNLDIYVHTASKYDDCRLLHVPNIKLSIKMEWLCLGNPHDHHSVRPCAPDKIPEYSSNQVHDSYRAFRSQNLNLSISMETKPLSLETPADVPTMLLYSNTLRWIETVMVILSGTSHLTRRGVLFNNTKTRKPQLTRHYKYVHLSFGFHKFQVCYWMSVAKQKGFEWLGGRFALGSEHKLALKPVNDGLKHRPRADWSTSYMTCDLIDSEIWLFNCASHQEQAPSSPREPTKAPLERSYFVSMTRVSYGREAAFSDSHFPHEESPPSHQLVVHGLRGAWTKGNRDVVFGLFDTFTKARVLKRNLSTEALKGFKLETPSLQRSRSQTATSTSSTSSPPISRLQSTSGHAASMLQKLIAESEANSMVYTEEIEGSSREEQLHGVAACQTDDVLHKNWLIELINCQVMLQGCETSGYVIVSAAKAKILQRNHVPVWKDRSLVSKTTWVGSVESLQYYATVDAGLATVDNIIWLSEENIQEKPSTVICDLPDLVGSGQGVGGVVSSVVGSPPEGTTLPLQLQRIVSRCGCQFFYASYGESIDLDSLIDVPPMPEEDTDPWEHTQGVDSFTLMHPDLTICTNSLQYTMILDIVNNLLLYVEPHKKEAFERLQTMRFRLQLSSIEDQKGPILEMQNHVRDLVQKLRRLEKETYLVQKALDDNSPREDLQRQRASLESEVEVCKMELISASEELNLMIHCFRETQVSALKVRQRASKLHSASPIRYNEVCFKYAQWRLTHTDGQLGIADLVLSNFLYSKVTKNDDSVEHLLELGYIKATNLLPNQIYKDVLQSTDLQSTIPADRQRALRIFCRERAPIGGISVKEHFEVNINPITIGLTQMFYTTMMKFFFPGRYSDKVDPGDQLPLDVDAEAKTDSKSVGEPKTKAENKVLAEVKSKKKVTLGHQRVPSHPTSLDDIEKMKERAEKNQTFLYIKVPEVPLRVSYKGGKEKNIEDLHDLNLILPNLEYHNRTWTWLDLLIGMKNDSKRVLLSQAIKQKLQIKSSRSNQSEDGQPQQEEDKARLLLGNKLLGAPEKTTKKGLFSKSSKRD